MEEEFIPPSGDRVRVLLQYEKEPGKWVTVPAQRWVREIKTKKTLAYDWVFAGSKFYPDPEGKTEDYYGANDGRVICLANFVTALLDLPVRVEEGNPVTGLDFEANTPEIPPLETPVTVILEPMIEKKGEKQ